MANLTVTQGDSGVFSLTVNDSTGAAHDLTGATLTTYIPGFDSNGSPFDVVLPSGNHTIDPDQVNNRGKFTVSFATTDGTQFQIGRNHTVITKMVQNTTTTYFHGVGVLDVLSASTVR